MTKKYLLVLILVILAGCQKETTEWNPIFEETNFDFLYTDIERSLSLINEAYLEAGENKQESIQGKLSQAKKRLLEIKDYYVPLTDVRQKIYDAERYFKLKNIKKAEQMLRESKSIISSLDLTTENEVFDKVIVEINSMIDKVLATFDESSSINTYNKMKALGERINLMLSRGDLVLSGIEFEN